MSDRPASSPPTEGRDERGRDTEHDENTPLLAGTEHSRERGGDDRRSRSPAASALLRAVRGLGGKRSGNWRWPSIIALLVLCLVVILIIVLGFMTPEIIKEYAEQAMVVDIASISIPAFTASGVQARVQGSFKIDGSRVKKKSVRDIGRFGTWIASKAETYETTVKVYIPEYDNVVLGSAELPRIKVSVRDGEVTPFDILAHLTPGPPDGIRSLADGWLAGRLGRIRLVGKASVAIRSGIIYVPEQKITHELLLDDSNLPQIPHYDISRLNIYQFDMPNGQQGLAVDTSVSVENDYPLNFVVPPLGFAILVQGCEKDDPYIMVADALTDRLHVEPKTDITANVTGHVRQLPNELTKACPKSDKSPLDAFLGNYIHGDETTIYVQGSDSPDVDTPRWITDIIKDITVPVSLKGRTFKDLIRNFSLEDVHFELPDPFAAPGSNDANPTVSAKVKALVNIPEEMNFPVNVSRVRANATVFYKETKLGLLDLHKWQSANSTRIEGHGKVGPALDVESVVDNAPLIITNNTLFTEVIEELIFSGKRVLLNINANVDVDVGTALGTIRVQQVPAKGVVPIKAISPGGDHPGTPGLGKLHPKVNNLTIVDSSKNSLTISCSINFTNPTNYSATIPYLDINFLVNDTILGHGTIRDMKVKPGNNSDITVVGIFDPAAFGGDKSIEVGRQLLSQYVSGFNTTLSVQAHKGSIPSQPGLGEALSALKIRFPTPRLHTPDPDNPDSDENSGRFIRSATMHVFTSEAEFTLASPFAHNTLYITKLNATASYKGDPVGKITHDLPFAIRPGISETPRLPVDWSLGSVGFGAIKDAVGGVLRLSATADVGVRLQRFEQTLWFVGSGIGAKIKA